MDHPPTPVACAPPLASPHLGASQMRARILAKLRYQVGKSPERASPRDWFMATAFAVRDFVVECWFESAPPLLRERGQARLLSVARVPDRPPARRRHGQSRADRRRARGAGAGGRGPRRRCASGSRTRRSAMAASAASPPASWRAWPRSSINAFGYGIRYEHGLFRQVIAAGVQQELPEDWLSFGNPWEFERPEFAYRIGFGGNVAASADGVRPDPLRVAARRGDPGRRLRHPGRRRRRRARQHAAPLVRPRADPAAPGGLQPRRPRRRTARTRAHRGGLARALPRRRQRRRAGAAAAAGVLLRLRLAAGPDPPPPRAVRHRPHPGRQGRHPAQRHPSRHRRHRADAPADGRARARVGRGLAHHRRHASPTPTTRCCRRRSRPGRCR